MDSTLALPLPVTTGDAAMDGFEAALAHALTELVGADPVLETGPADFGLWGVIPDGHSRLDLDQVARQLHASLPPLCRNLGKACHQHRLTLEPPLRLLMVAGKIDCGSDLRAPALQALLAQYDSLQKQTVRLLAGYALVRGAATLIAHQRVLARLGPARLAQAVADHPEYQATPTLALSCRPEHIAVEEARGLSWRPLAAADDLTQELIVAGLGRAAAVQAAVVPVSEAFDPIRSQLDRARRGQR